jgi:hypothetical protein
MGSISDGDGSKRREANIRDPYHPTHELFYTSGIFPYSTQARYFPYDDAVHTCVVCGRIDPELTFTCSSATCADTWDNVIITGTTHYAHRRQGKG